MGKILKRAQLILEGLRAEGWVVGVCQMPMLHWRLGFLEVPILKLKQPDPGGVPQGVDGDSGGERAQTKALRTKLKSRKCCNSTRG